MRLKKILVPRRGLEPPRPQGALAPEASASTNSAIWASENGLGDLALSPPAVKRFGTNPHLHGGPLSLHTAVTQRQCRLVKDCFLWMVVVGSSRVFDYLIFYSKRRRNLGGRLCRKPCENSALRGASHWLSSDSVYPDGVKCAVSCHHSVPYYGPFVKNSLFNIPIAFLCDILRRLRHHIRAIGNGQEDR